MTCQAIICDFALLVTGHAVLHRDWHNRRRNRFREFANISMTGLAFYLTANYVSTMRKINVIGHSVDLLPRDFFPFRYVLNELLLLG